MIQESRSFVSMNLSKPISKAIDAMGFVTPSPIQAGVIPYLIEGRDAIAQAQTGTGKTAAFAIPVLEKLDAKSSKTQALVLAPTRELAIQVAEQIEQLSQFMPGVIVSVLCGGQEYRRQLKQLRDGAQIVVGTPGRILDHIERGSLQLGQLKTFVLDEADEMLRMGFIEDVETILEQLPEQKQMALFSATMPTRIRQIAQRYLHNEVSVKIESETATVKAIEQRFLFAAFPQKNDALLRVLAVEDSQGVIVFVKTKSSAEDVAQALQQHGLRAMAIHGDITQALRERIIQQFRQGAIDILVATDVAARGLDVERVTHVINYDVPQDCETYVHRIGRTGRAGRSGATILFVTPREGRMLNMIERHTRQKIEKMTVPNDKQIQNAKRRQIIAQFGERLQSEHLSEYKQLVEHALSEYPDAHPIELAAAALLMAHGDKPLQQNLPAFQEAKEPQRTRFNKHEAFDSEKPARRRTDRKNRDTDYAEELFRLEVGRLHGVKPGNIIGAIANETGLAGKNITGLKIHDEYSTVRLPQGLSKQIFKGIQNAWVCGRQLQLTSMGAV